MKTAQIVIAFKMKR